MTVAVMILYTLRMNYGPVVPEDVERRRQLELERWFLMDLISA